MRGREHLRLPVAWFWAFTTAMGIACGLGLVVCFVLWGAPGQPTLGALAGFLVLALAVWPSLRFAHYMARGLWPPS